MSAGEFPLLFDRDTETQCHRGIRVAVIIVTWNSAKFIRDCLSSIPAEFGPTTLVIDNDSADDTVAIVRAEFPQVQVKVNSGNEGYAKANNQGLQYFGFDRLSAQLMGSRFDAALLLNPDTRLPAQGIEKLAEYLATHPEAGVVAPKLINPDGSAQASVRRFPTYRNMFATLVGAAGEYRMRGFAYDVVQEVEQPMASCLLIRSSVIEQVGLLDERFPMFFNDVDWLKRIHEAGWKVVYLPEVAVWHYVGGSTEQRRKAMISSAHRSLFHYFRKHDRSGWFWLKAVPLAVILEFVALLRILFLRKRQGS